jgi:hypothetical protein
MDLSARISLTGLDWGICLSLLVFSIAVFFQNEEK